MVLDFYIICEVKIFLVCVIDDNINIHYNVLIAYGGFMFMEKFVVVPKEDKAVTMTIRIDRALQERYNELSMQTNRSRNELIGMALQYALDNMEIKDK